MIETLTTEQKKLLEVYAKRYIDIGLNTDRFDEDFATPIIHEFQEKVLEIPKTPVLVFDNPIECMMAIVLFEDDLAKVETKVDDKVRSKVRSKVWSKVGDNVRSKVWSKVDDKVRSKVWSKVRSKVGDNVRSKVWSKVEDKVETKVDDKVRSKVWSKVGRENGIYPYQDGSFFVNVFAFYDYMEDVLGIDLSEYNYKAWRDTMYLGLIYPLDDICIVCQKPQKIRFNEDGKLHGDGVAAIEYAGDYNVYALNDIIVPEQLAMMPAGNLDIKLFLKEKNTDIKAEFLRKYGIERMIKYGTLVDSYKNYTNEWWIKSEYEVWDMKELFDGITRHNHCCFLKMRNQTTGIWHLEGISPKCGEVNTVAKALEIRERIKQDTVKTLWVT